MIGMGRQAAGQNLPQLLAVPGVQVVSVCDVDRWRMEQARQQTDAHYTKQADKTYKGCRIVPDFRNVINDKGIDALMISTPDHWHLQMALMAAQAKKHFACEKPLTLSVQQGRLMADAVKRAGIIARTDSEFRSVRPQNRAVELVRNGYLGKLEKIEITFPSDPTPVPPQPDMPVPKDLNYNMWLGPAPDVPYTQMRVHDPNQLTKRPNWMRISTYAQGMITNWGAHYFDLVQWANKSENSGPVAVWGQGEFPRGLWNTMINFEVNYRYANGLLVTCRQTPTSKPGIRYTGSEGWIFVDGYPGTLTASNPQLLDTKLKPGELDLSATLWDKNDFIEGIRAKRETLEPIDVGHRTITISQIGLIACELGADTEDKKLVWDPAQERFENNNAANALLAAPLQRTDWVNAM